jgi:hypothetical protein
MLAAQRWNQQTPHFWKQDMDLSALAEIIRTFAGVVGILGIPAAYFTYRRSVRTRRAEWFVLLASLRKLRQISDDEIVGLFDYDLRMIATHEFVVAALRPQGFERLADLIQRPPFLPRQ